MNLSHHFGSGLSSSYALMIVYFAVTLITPRHQSIHDLIVKTLVVRTVGVYG